LTEESYTEGREQLRVCLTPTFGTYKQATPFAEKGVWSYCNHWVVATEEWCHD